MCQGAAPAPACDTSVGQCDCFGNVQDECGECGGSGIPVGACTCAATEQCQCGGFLRADVCGMCDPWHPAQSTTAGACSFSDDALRSGVVIPQANSDLNKAMQLSGLYCHWSADNFDQCPDGHVWDGVANFAVDDIRVDGNMLSIPFVESYQGDALCFVTFENVNLHHREK